ncbi:MAG TPA: DUF2252 domain-containing protein [Casimicrobiaceae bacterium]|nr:DUF2252 domain-containing protein [Casimicrobiaceae bacterium]
MAARVRGLSGPSPYPQQFHSRPEAERAAFGLRLRQRCPRNAHARWRPARTRPDPIALLIASDKGRLPNLIPLRYGRMMASPFTFYRGAAAIMASDLARTPATGIAVQACGDCHLLNFGGFATPERRLVFDINDFDETAIAPWEWDVKRLAASFVIAGRANRFTAADCREAAWWAARRYRERLAEYARAPVIDAWHAAIDLEALVASGTGEALRSFSRKRVLKAAQASQHHDELHKLTHEEGDFPRITDSPPLVFHLEDATSHGRYQRIIQRAFRRYVETLDPSRRVLLDRYELADVAIKVVGIGSVGTECGIALFMSGNGEPLFLQFKEARASVLEAHAGRSAYKHHGQRVVAGQRIMQAASDAFLGWTSGDGGRHVYVRQLSDVKIKPVVEMMKPLDLLNYAKACGWALARAHARTGDAVMLSAYMGKGDAFEDAMSAFGVAYANQNERDYAKLIAAIRAGRIMAEGGGEQ